MWLMTPEVVVSIVQKKKGNRLCIRARDQKDLVILRNTYLPSMSKISSNQGSDYPFRAYASREAVAQAAAAAVRDITYPNFKSEVMKRRGAKREKVMHNVWFDLLDLEGPRADRRHKSYYDFQEPLWTDADMGYGNDPSGWDDEIMATCPVCQERIPVSGDRVDPNLTDDELVAAVAKVSLEIGEECQWNDSGNHWGWLPFDPLTVEQIEQAS